MLELLLILPSFLLLMTIMVNYILGAILVGFPDIWKMKLDYSYQPRVSIIIPAFNEGADVVYATLVSVCNQVYPQDKIEIIAVDDCSVDDTNEGILRAAKEFPSIIRACQTPENSGGKDGATLFGYAFATGDVILLTDSDTLFDENTVRELIAPLADPTIGAVSGAVLVRNGNETWLAAYQAYTYWLIFNVTKIPMSWCRRVACCSGAMHTTRREIFERLRPALEIRDTGFGTPVHDGEDRWLSHRVILMGYGTYMNPAAKCWTAVPATIKAYFLQQQRWRKSGLRDLFFTIRHLREHLGHHPMVWYGYLVLPLTPFAAMLGLVGMLLSPMAFVSGISSAIMFLGLGMLATIFIKIFDHEHRITNPLRLVFSVTVWLLQILFVTPLALFTLDSGGWATRDKKAMEAQNAV